MAILFFSFNSLDFILYFSLISFVLKWGLTERRSFIMDTSQICIMIAIIVYLLFVLGVGVYFSKKNNNVGDFYLGGRKLGPFVTAMSAEASDMSSWLLMGLPGVAYLTGIADAAWTAMVMASI